MELFIKVIFWVILLEISTKLSFLGFSNYPRGKDRWEDMTSIALQIPIIIWAATIIYK